MVFRRKVEMNNKKTSSWNLGVKGYIIVILAFFSCYVYSALTSDSLNVTRDVFIGLGINQAAVYAMSTIAVPFGIIGSIILGRLINKHSIRLYWGLSMIITAVFTVLIGQVHNTVGVVVCYVVIYTFSLASAMLLAGEIIGHWFPTKRGVAMGLCTAGYPLSAATTSAVAGMFVGTVGYSAYYIAIAVIAVIVGIVVIVFVRDFPEEKGGYPDNNPAFDGEKAKAEHQAALEYLKTSKWTALKCLKTGRMWVLWIAVGITGFMSMGIMSNFVTKFMVMGYELPTVLQMLGIAGVLAIPGSIVVGWLDVKIGTKKTGILINVLAFVAVLCCLTHVTVLHYISLPILAVMLGGSSNLMVSCTAAIWGRYDFKNAFSVIQPLNSVMTGVGITVVSACNSIDPTCQLAYIIMAVMAVIGLIAMFVLKVEPIDSEVR